MFGICNLAIVPVRAEASDRSEQVSQLLFGEHFKIIEMTAKWVQVELAYDGYIGWIDSKQYQAISEEQYQILNNTPIVLNADLVEYITTPNNQLTSITLGASLSFLDNEEINTNKYSFEGIKVCGEKPKSDLVKTAFMYLNAPYLWGGKTPFGIDCSGFTQMVYKLNGHKLLRDASQQATQGEIRRAHV